jgi:FMN phosphatase YigB (HAD superfamily)
MSDDTTASPLAPAQLRLANYAAGRVSGASRCESSRMEDSDGDSAVISKPGKLSSATYLLISPSQVLYDDTLWWRWLLQMVSRFGLHTNNDMFTSLWQSDYYDDVCQGDREVFDALQEFLTCCGLRRGQVDELCAAGRLHWRRLELELRAFPQTLPAIAALAQQGWRMGLLMHCPLSTSEAKSQLEQMRIARFFDHVVGSREIATRFSLPDFWSDVAQRLSVSPERIALMCHETRQLSAAKSAGLTTLAFQCDGHHTADATLNRVDEVLSLGFAQPGRCAA